MQSSKLGNQAWAVAFYMAASNLKGISSLKLRRELETAQRAAWHMPQRFPVEASEPEVQIGIVKCDAVLFTAGRAEPEYWVSLRAPHRRAPSAVSNSPNLTSRSAPPGTAAQDPSR